MKRDSAILSFRLIIARQEKIAESLFQSRVLKPHNSPYVTTHMHINLFINEHNVACADLQLKVCDWRPLCGGTQCRVVKKFTKFTV